MKHEDVGHDHDERPSLSLLAHLAMLASGCVPGTSMTKTICFVNHLMELTTRYEARITSAVSVCLDLPLFGRPYSGFGRCTSEAKTALLAQAWFVG